jgi:hypothetical protein
MMLAIVSPPSAPNLPHPAQSSAQNAQSLAQDRRCELHRSPAPPLRVLAVLRPQRRSDSSPSWPQAQAYSRRALQLGAEFEELSFPQLQAATVRSPGASAAARRQQASGQRRLGSLLPAAKLPRSLQVKARSPVAQRSSAMVAPRRWQSRPAQRPVFP